MAQAFNDNLRRALDLARDMLDLAERGERDQTDSGCGILYSLVRDMGYRLRKAAEEERERHRRAGRWD